MSVAVQDRHIFGRKMDNWQDLTNGLLIGVISNYLERH